MYEILHRGDGDIYLRRGDALLAWWSCTMKQIHVLQPDPQHTLDGRECTRAEALLMLTAFRAQLEKENGL